MNDGGRVALYWDFENVHASVLDELQGDGTYRRVWRQPQEPVAELDPVVDFAAGFGSVVINRAYGNWQRFGKYQGPLQAHAVDLVQMFPLSGLKNGADIRLALDVMEDLHQHPHITHVVVVAGDSDYVALAQKCRKLGRRFIAVGMPKTNALFKAACDEFRYHRSLVAASELGKGGPSAPDETPALYDLDHAADLVERALRRLSSGRDTPWVLKSGLRPMLVRFDPAFDEANYGFASLSNLIKALGDQVEVRVGTYDQELALRSALGAASAGVPEVDAAQLAATDPVARTLRSTQVRLPADRSLLWRSVPEVIALFEAHPDGTVPTLHAFVAELLERLQAADPSVTEQDAKWLKNVYLKVGAFEWHGPDVGNRLRTSSAAEIIDRMIRGLLDRIRNQQPALLSDEDVVLRGLCGDGTPVPVRAELQRILRAEFAPS